MPEYDYTMMSTYMTCQRKYWFRMVKGLAPRHVSAAPEFGRCIHKALDEWYITGDIDKAVQVFIDSFVADHNDDMRTHELGEWILRNYAAKYQDQGFKVLMTEMEFSIKLPNDNRLIGRMDKIINWDGALWVMDHKTTSGLTSHYMKMHTPNLQFDGYTYAARKLGYNVQGILVDAILVAKGLLDSTRRRNLTPLLRDFAYRTDEDLVRYEKQIMRIQSDIELKDDEDSYLPNLDACTYYGECPYRRICIEPREVWERIEKSDYKHEPWHPHTKENTKT